MESPPSPSMLQAIGRGTVIALVVFGLPCLLVVRFYDELKAWSDGLSGLPILHTMQNDFKSGVEVVGTNFAATLKAFYADTTLSEVMGDKRPPDRRWQPKLATAYWDRAAVANELRETLSRRNQANARAYLDYVEQYRPLALEEMAEAKIPASVTLAQGILETNAGRAFLARKANNHFGIKCRSKAGFRRGGISDDDFTPHSLAVDCVQMTDDYVWDRFEVYDSPHESYRRHSLLLHENRYRWMLRAYEVGGLYTIPRKLYGRTEVPYYAAWCVGLKSSGYATAPNYAETLTMIIETYQLWKIDYELLL